MKSSADVLTGFRSRGYHLLEGFFPDPELQGIRDIVRGANGKWMDCHRDLMDKGAINSAYLTSPTYSPSEADRGAMFRFVAMDKLVDLAADLMGRDPYFGNTQAFFNPTLPGRKPYWHRDIQYSGLPEEEQKALIHKDSVLHFRVPLADDPGLEFIPGSHLRWDTAEERKVRLELDGRKNHEDLPDAVTIPHRPGDLLVFTAHVIHKGIYRGDRLSLDILFASFPESRGSVEKYRHFPDDPMKSGLDNRRIFDLK